MFVAPAARSAPAINPSGAAAPNQRFLAPVDLRIFTARRVTLGVGNKIFARSLITTAPNFSSNCLSNSLSPF